MYEEVLSADNVAVTTSNRSEFAIGTNCNFALDDIQMAAGDALTKTTTFAYDDANELLTMATGGVDTIYTYDEWGRTVTKQMTDNLSYTQTAVYGYRFGDKLKSMTSDFPDESSGAMNYDGFGHLRNLEGDDSRWVLL